MTGFYSTEGGRGGVAATGGTGQARGEGGASGSAAGSGQSGGTAVGGSAGTMGGMMGGMMGGGGVAPLPAGSVQMFVAVGRGGRRMMSCDRGRTWIADQMVAPESIHVSDDGQRWTKAKAPTGNGLTALVAGAGSPSSQCPLP